MDQLKRIQLAQDCGNSSALGMELLQFCFETSMCKEELIC